MPISFKPMREYMERHHISYYYLANQGIDPQTLHRIRHDRSITTETLGRLCALLGCQPGQLIRYEAERQE